MRKIISAFFLLVVVGVGCSSEEVINVSGNFLYEPSVCTEMACGLETCKVGDVIPCNSCSAKVSFNDGNNIYEVENFNCSLREIIQCTGQPYYDIESCDPEFDLKTTYEIVAKKLEVNDLMTIYIKNFIPVE